MGKGVFGLNSCQGSVQRDQRILCRHTQDLSLLPTFPFPLFVERQHSHTLLSRPISNHTQVLPPVEALLDVCAHPDHEISDMSFSFWHKLSMQLTRGSSIAEQLHFQQQQQQFPPPPPGSPGGQQLAAAAVQPIMGDPQQAAEQQRRREFFAPCFERLLSLVRSRMR